MVRKRKPVAPSGPTYPRVIETYNDPRWALESRTLTEPTCINGDVRVELYRITIEKLDEPGEVLRDRLVRLWRESERNSHTWEPMRAAAMRLLGITQEEARALLLVDDQGIDHKERR